LPEDKNRVRLEIINNREKGGIDERRYFFALISTENKTT
jgi:hypothetical protein